MYPGNNKFIVLDEERYKEQYKRFGDVILTNNMYDKTRYDKVFTLYNDNRVQIQCGCINDCRFCVNELHKSISVPHLDIIKEINSMSVDNIMLSGVNIALYNDGEVSLAGLCKSIFDNCKHIESVMLSGLDLQQLDEVEEVIDIVKDYDKIYPIFHFPIHTCNSELLKRNRLNYSMKHIDKIMSLCKNNNILYSWDIICGLPGETDKMFNDTLEMVKKYKPVVVYIYPFNFLTGSGYDE